MERDDIAEFLEVVAELAADLDEAAKEMLEAKLLCELQYNPSLHAYPGNVWAGIYDATPN